MSAKTEYENKKTELHNYVQQMRESAKKYFAESCQQIFKDYPVLVSFSWRQYTPYFNDGDTCHFGVHEVSEVNGQDVYDLDEEDGVYQMLKVAIDACEALVSSFDEDDMEAMFGDHVTVTVTRDSVETESCDHD